MKYINPLEIAGFLLPIVQGSTIMFFEIRGNFGVILGVTATMMG
jgi:hypothetical protein